MASKETLAGCPVQHALQYISGKWQMGILWQLRQGPIRFNALKDTFPGLSEKVLTENLKFFEEKGIVEKQSFPSVPPKVEYQLTADGQTLLPVIEKVIRWGYTHLQEEKVQRDTLHTPSVVMNELEQASNSSDQTGV
ncbi:winged helix-turn-helix transcriptional regulator [Chitinophaga nivalis]|uniref:Helix-turn-helix transcriptional regulator n=1 Tax=Chitinophaga nivalis TaxID=2991709 RepID=A0ABT3IHC7_9BACT|nr:helix-turn-helix domain-containing protein [Chitinophaga nivalis]MCW3466988.1 helix-turn-helix transcriptional regulator [Chitinophaga nivalis]MCW3483321.1 helix-turn-helix transcriptional regulator [Chitinophaga nivalis]